MSADLRHQHLHFDCVSGVAGDMTLGALFHLGVPESVVREALAALGIEPARLRVAPVLKHGIAAIDVTVDTSGAVDHLRHEHEHAHDHEHEHAHDHEHMHAHYRDIVGMIERAPLAPGVADRALDMFGRVARAEARMHGSAVEAVVFHEVGALDSIVDIVGTAAALAWLAPTSISASAVAMGHGTIRCAHGVLPVPSPAALEIMKECGGLTTDGGLSRELCTPTGAAIVAASVTSWGPMPPLTPLATGYGAGDADLEDRANVVRLIVGRPQAAASDVMMRLEANVDDMSPELCEHAAAQLVGAGAVDVWWTPIVMKRGRPALLLGALAPVEQYQAVVEAILRETSTIGVRYDRVARRVLERRQEWVETAHGRARIKLATRDGVVLNAAPEYEDCRQLAVATGVPLKRIYAAVMAAYATRLAPKD
ncbi:MAG TPA: nickel pincer cofactor biosynthesis protein LarC [Kofleriaceae bacterium]|nr:nickel pincer cofactor biosynthesis protein LarC [Kofleriaceae bacterium]